MVLSPRTLTGEGYMRKGIAIAAGVALAAAALVMAFRSQAGYPMISGLTNKILKPGQSTGVISFHIQDDKPGAESLDVDAGSDNQDLVPDGNITLGGSGSTRTVEATTVPGRTGTANIRITVTDTDGESNQDSFQIEAVQAPNI